MKRKDRQKERERREAVNEACQDEMRRFNAAIANGKTAILHTTSLGDYFVRSVTTDWWYMCSTQQNSASMFDQHSFAGCNDGSWASLMNQVEEPRNPLFANLTIEEA